MRLSANSAHGPRGCSAATRINGDALSTHVLNRSCGRGAGNRTRIPHGAKIAGLGGTRMMLTGKGTNPRRHRPPRGLPGERRGPEHHRSVDLGRRRHHASTGAVSTRTRRRGGGARCLVRRVPQGLAVRRRRWRRSRLGAAHRRRAAPVRVSYIRGDLRRKCRSGERRKDGGVRARHCHAECRARAPRDPTDRPGTTSRC